MVGEVDFTLGHAEGMKSIADGRVKKAEVLPCEGNLLEIEHNIGGAIYRSRYMHLLSFNVSRNQEVQQGAVIGGVDNTGSCTNGTHLHLGIVNSAGVPVEWPAQISQTSSNMWSIVGHAAISNNAGAGMWGPGGAYEDTEVKNLYFLRNGWTQFGSVSRMEPSWEVCNSSGSNRIVHVCGSQFGNIRAQTFRAVGGNWRSALVGPHGRAGAVGEVPQGFFAAYTDQYSPGQVWSYRLGMPTGGLYLPFPSDPDLVALNFEGGWYMWWRKSTCTIAVFLSGVQQRSVNGSPRYCAAGGGGAEYGYGSNGN
jgi:hypothetical protein